MKIQKISSLNIFRGTKQYKNFKTSSPAPQQEAYAQQSRTGVFAHRVHKNALDIEKIESIVLPPQQKVSMLSFADSDKKFTLDRYQREAIDSYKADNNTIVTAPTGTGKTLIAEYCIEDALKNGDRIIYLSPLKALSNEKFSKFSELFGKYDENGNFLNSDDVGILTGDVTINPDAKLLVMTTEIYRNIVGLKDKDTTAQDFKDYTAVIYDEFHYLNDPNRGTVWEEAVMHTPKHMRQVMLSATASNAQELADWLQKLNPTRKTVLINVPEDERYVPLREHTFGYNKEGYPKIEQVRKSFINPAKLKNSLSDRQKQIVQELERLYNGQNFISILSGFQTRDGLIDADSFADELIKAKRLKNEKAQQIAYILSDREETKNIDTSLTFSSDYFPVKSVVNILDKTNKTPALFFVFSKKRCKEYLDDVSSNLGTLLTPEESKRVLDAVNEAKSSGIYLGDDFDKEYLNKLLMGYTVHHAGMLPAYKSLAEKLAREGLIKVCFATETLLAGINMPFRTVVFTSIRKYDNNKMIEIPPTTYKQGAGRAGRRGKDDIGNVIVMPSTQDELRKYESLMDSKDTKVKSAFNLSYASLLQESLLNNLPQTLEDSFFAFQAGSTQKIKKEAKSKVAYLREKGYIARQDGKNVLTEKGDMAKNVYGINQILFCELMSDPCYTQNLSAPELAALMTMFADVKDDKANLAFDSSMKNLERKLKPAIQLAQKIASEQKAKKIDEPILMSTNLTGAILRFAQSPSQSLDAWDSVFKDLKTKGLISHEGDLLRVINGTIELLRTIKETTDNPVLYKKAQDAINALKKPPVTDILKYELDIT